LNSVNSVVAGLVSGMLWVGNTGPSCCLAWLSWEHVSAHLVPSKPFYCAGWVEIVSCTNACGFPLWFLLLPSLTWSVSWPSSLYIPRLLFNHRPWACYGSAKIAGGSLTSPCFSALCEESSLTGDLSFQCSTEHTCQSRYLRLSCVLLKVVSGWLLMLSGSPRIKQLFFSCWIIY